MLFRSQRFNYSVSCRYLCTAASTLSTKYAPAYYRYQVTPFDRLTAGHTVRISLDKTFIFRQSVYADIKKTAYARSEDEHKYINDYV